MAYMIVTRIAILFIIMASLHIASYHTDALAKPGKFVATLAHNLDAAGNLPPTTFDSGKVKVKFTDAPDSVKLDIKGISAPDETFGTLTLRLFVNAEPVELFYAFEVSGGDVRLRANFTEGVNTDPEADNLFNFVSGQNIEVFEAFVDIVPGEGFEVFAVPGAIFETSSEGAAAPGSPSSSIPDITGTYAGSGMFTLSNCQDDFLNDTFSGVSLTISITSQTGGQFTGSQSLRLNVLGVTYTEEGTISGTITSDGSISGTGSSDGFIDGDFDSSSEGTFTGSVAGTTLVVEGRSQDTVGDTCLSTSSFTLQRQ